LLVVAGLTRIVWTTLWGCVLGIMSGRIGSLRGRGRLG